jgi:5-methylcytosine-specific restriction enzyme subunit McrC
MLRHFRDENGVSFQTASLDAKRDFPMLEAYISSFLKELEELIIRGIKKDYAQEEELLSCLKGKIVLHKQVIQELKNKTKFVVQHSKYQESIPINRILVSALAKLKQLSRNQSNLQKILILQSLLDGIKPSSNIDGDLMRASKSNRLFSDYRRLIDWCALFLTNKGVVTFSGKFINQSFLFQADKLFESYIAFLAKKYLSKDFNVNVQDHRHYLIENHSGKRLFSLRPDIYLERKDNTRSDLPESVIIDTKWKRIDENNHKGYGIDQDDLYQMFAYGKKYQSSGSIPCMILLYPYCDTFTSSLASFIYDINQGGSSLQVIASSFNLADEANYESMLRELLKNVVNSQSLISNNLPV